MILKIPGKTFLLGEYLAMKTGESILLTNSPLFVMQADFKFEDFQVTELQSKDLTLDQLNKMNELLNVEFESEISFFKMDHDQHFCVRPQNSINQTELENSLLHKHFQIFHPESPAGKFIFRHREFFKHISIQWQDPYRNSGGLGASTAQYIGIIIFFYSQVFKLTKSRSLILDTELDQFEFGFTDFEHAKNNFKSTQHFHCNEKMRSLLLKNYQTDAWNGQGQKPSGQDFLAQLFGGQDWIWPDLSMIMVRTGFKLATHHHLQNLNHFECETLHKIYNLAIKAIEQRDIGILIQSVNAYADELENLGFVADHTKEIIKQLKRSHYVQAIKGCGAMGADLCLILCYQVDEEKLINELNEKSYQIAFKTSDLYDTGVMIYEN